MTNHVHMSTRASTYALQQRVRELVANWRGSDTRLVRVRVPFEGANAFDWLRARPGAMRMYWAGREGKEVVAATGVADCCSSTANASGLRSCLAPMLSKCDPDMRYYGGMRFDHVPPFEDAWSAFGAFKFVLPRFEVRSTDRGPDLACNLVMPRDSRFADSMEGIELGIGRPPAPIPVPCARLDDPDKGRWDAMVSWALNAFSRSSLNKVVFARKAVYRFSDVLEPISILESLQAGAPDCFHFCFQPAGAPAFVGASPERLFRRRGRHVESEALAGTRPRGASDEEDARLLADLTGSKKDGLEHDYVRVSLKEQLEPLSSAFYLDEESSVMKLASTLHLLSRVRASLRAGVTSLDVLAALHPTPAVGGYPAGKALEAIRSRECFDRGWYAGPVGWIGPDAAEFAVGIRSGLVRGRSLSLYSGAGIVRGSTPDAEWEEIEHKIGAFVRVLGLEEWRGAAALGL